MFAAAGCQSMVPTKTQCEDRQQKLLTRDEARRTAANIVNCRSYQAITGQRCRLIGGIGITALPPMATNVVTNANCPIYDVATLPDG